MTAEPDLRREPLETAGQPLNAGLQPLDAERGPLANRPRPLDPDVLTVLNLPMQDPRVRPLLDELAVEYDMRYGDLFGREGAAEELNRYPAEEFAGPGGALLVIQENGESIAGGAFRRYDDATAELKRIWTHSAHRRRGLARLVLAELEALAVRRGYTRLYLTTGPRQPEAKHLYLTTGYEPQFDLDADPETIKFLAFTKDLSGHLQN
ncbi:GNAT superfamily N-acetyltransferase [Pseudarthrobacter siccitolerans]|uniref:GNAT superfamily N-acetyltransferase n=2 Tax=Pseudarthrobacter siccitolerans TaxID=861266 RepID=A0ABU0PLA2_9MICC|nr:GNAT superfamily N-acetyltransferase [Pseudarthrobacter siccitolerans]